ncbi:MAG TPA: hypothetical protein VKQ32_06350 [Polyangia bacterium]|nr:hypothetical protein [Polyangia bacterium]
MTYRICAFVVAVGLAGLIGCGSSNGMLPSGTGGGSGSTGTGGAGGSTSGVTGTKRLDSLTPTEQQMICDWAAAQLGGYGHSVDCGGGNMITAEPDQATCIADAPTSCAGTVSQYEACIRDVSCTNLLPTSCAPFLQCM